MGAQLSEPGAALTAPALASNPSEVQDMPIIVDPDVRSRIYERLDTEFEASASGCRVWTGGTCREGYGRLKVSRKYLYVHRIAAERWLGEPPAGKPLVLHHCDNPPCFDAGHLHYGDRADNALEAYERRLQAAKYDEATVREVLRAYRAGEASQERLAVLHGMSPSQVHRIVTGRHWHRVWADQA